MTVCIGAIFDNGKTIATISDRKISTWSSSSDGLAVKVRRIKGMWTATYSANNLGHIPQIIELAKRKAENAENSVQSLMASMKDAYQEERRSAVENSILSSFGMNLADFLSTGKDAFTDEEHASLCSRIDEFDLECDFLVCGFDDKCSPHIFTVCNPGIASSHDETGYWAIGSGATVAIGSLMLRQMGMQSEYSAGIYHLAEAKFNAERAPGVGVQSIMTLCRSDNSIALVGPEEMQEIAAILEREGRPSIPTDAKLRIMSLAKFNKLEGENIS